MMKATIIIPARYNSTRFPGKPLALIRQKNQESLSLIELTWRAAKKVKDIHKVYIATDNELIRKSAINFGADVLMTPEKCENGTSRCAYAIKKYSISDEVIINFQGDAPLTPPHFVENLVDHMRNDKETLVSTPVIKVDLSHYEKLLADKNAGLSGATTVVFDKNQKSLYFSKEIIPSQIVSNPKEKKRVALYHHVGIYAYRASALSEYTHWEKGPLEQSEGLEQLRFLENGYKIHCIKVKAGSKKFWEVNNPSDINIVQEIIKKS
ncbi:MAG: manno-octulosonate cytidylyltransferase [Pseudomonadota bacterium]|nr:manno-octulosonate cytidylyltransferase [Pseudomonadota bacterium]